MNALSAPHRGTQPLADDLACALDPVRFARRLGIEPDPWQADVLRSDDRRMLLNCSRQSGKSTVAGIVALHRAVYWPGSLVLMLSPSLRQSQELFRAASRLYLNSDLDAPQESSTQRLMLPNGSRIVGLPGSERTTRGFSGVALVILDEASRIEDALYFSVLPMLATTEGRLLAMSTPFGRRGWWADAWHDGHGWQRVQITADLCPRISPAFLAEQQRAMGDFWFQQEYLCQFSDTMSSAFRTIDIENARHGERVEPWFL